MSPHVLGAIGKIIHMLVNCSGCNHVYTGQLQELTEP